MNVEGACFPVVAFDVKEILPSCSSDEPVPFPIVVLRAREERRSDALSKGSPFAQELLEHRGCEARELQVREEKLRAVRSSVLVEDERVVGGLMCCRPPDKLKVVHVIPLAARRALSCSISLTIVLML
jgi:hypothetical protein